jgi:hypothetical protein
MRLRVPFPAQRRVRLRLPAPRLPARRRITLRAKLVGLIGGIGGLLVLLTVVGVLNLGRVSERGQHTFTHVTRPLAALGRARALINENATLAERHILEDARENKLSLEKRIAANDTEIDRQIALATPPRRPSAAARASCAPTSPRTASSSASCSAPRARARPRSPTSGPPSASIPRSTRSTPTCSSSSTPRSPRATASPTTPPRPTTPRAAWCSRCWR